MAAESARFGLPEPRHGFIPSQIIPFLVRRLGEAPVRRIAVTASVVDAREARRIGMVDVLAADVEVDAVLARELTNLRRAAPLAVAAVKRLVLDSTEQPLEAVLDQGAASLMNLLRGADAAARIDAFLGKRAPDARDSRGAHSSAREPPSPIGSDRVGIMDRPRRSDRLLAASRPARSEQARSRSELAG